MNLHTVGRSFASTPLEDSAFHPAEFLRNATFNEGQRGWTAQVKQALRKAGLTMARVSALTSARYGKQSTYFVAPTFFYKREKGITPHICQIVSLSQITGYRFADWMRVSGFDLGLILPLQLKIHTERTVLVKLDHALGAQGSSPLTQSSSFSQANERYYFAKIGRRDAVVYPRLLPGSIIRADRRYSPPVRVGAYEDDRLWLVEHGDGLTCCHVRWVDDEHLVLLPNCPPLSAWPLRLFREVRILGVVDLEFRPRQTTPFEPLCQGVRYRHVPSIGDSKLNFSTLLRRSRSRAGLTFRAAHDMTKRVAQLLGNRTYAIALGQLSDYEAMNRLPRHVAKIISLCIVYCIDPWQVLEAAGIHIIDDSDKAPLPNHHWGVGLPHAA